jgi:hypothetical protein
LYVSNLGPNVLYRNNGDGTFTDVTDEAAVGRGDKFGAGVGFLDTSNDGSLDLFAANYVAFSYQRHAQLSPTAFPFPPGPQDYPPLSGNLFRSNSDGSFADMSQSSGASLAGPGMGLICGDFDDDGDADIFVCNDAAANFLFVNDGGGKYQERAVVAGVAFDLHGNPNGNMGVDCGDYDNDGLIDMFVTNYSGQLPVLYRNAGRGFFDDATRQSQAGTTSFPHVKWGTALVDFDNDGDRDLFIANGHFLVNIRKTDDRTDYKVANMLYLNQDRRSFADASDRSGSGLAVVESSRGAAFDDLDNDGDIDGVVLNVNALPTILDNQSPAGGHWLQVLLVGVKSNRDGVGAKVRVVSGDLTQVAEVHSGRGYQSHFGTRLHFGLGPRRSIDRVEVRWPGRGVEVFHDVPVGKLAVLIEGTGQVR